jgi:signal peptidase I
LFLQRLPRPAIRRYDVVVVDSRVLRQRLAKRVIGLPGERVRVEEGWRVVVDGRPLPYTAEDATQARIEDRDHAILVVPGAARFEQRFAVQDLTLGPDEYFVMGDNRLASEDSRSFGPVHAAEIQGRLGRIWYSYDLERSKLRWDRLLRSP